jgi:hypothetical protein
VIRLSNKLQQIINESPRDGNGVIIHIDNFKWIIETISKFERENTQFRTTIESAIELIEREAFRTACNELEKSIKS